MIGGAEPIVAAPFIVRFLKYSPMKMDAPLLVCREMRYNFGVGELKEIKKE